MDPTIKSDNKTNTNTNSTTNISNNSHFDLQMISTNCNTVLNSMDYLENSNCLIFAASNLVHVYNLDDNKILFSLKGHKDRVNCVKVFSNTKFTSIVSCSTDGSINHWVNRNVNNKNTNTNSIFEFSNWMLEYKITNNNAINVFDYFEDVSNISNGNGDKTITSYIVFFTENSCLNLHSNTTTTTNNNTNTKYTEIKSIKSKFLQTALQFALFDTDIFLLTGGYDNLINIYHITSSTLKFCISLQGHLNALRGISVLLSNTNNTSTSNELFISSSSQDSLVRIWTLNKLSSEEILKYKSRKIDNVTIFDEYKAKTSYVFSTTKTETKEIKENTENTENYYHVLLDSVIHDHEDIVSSSELKIFDSKMYMITASFDFTLGVYEYDTDKQWNRTATLGEMAGNKHSFWGCRFLNSPNKIIGYTFIGSFYVFEKEETSSLFNTKPIVHGHYKPVTDIKWYNNSNNNTNTQINPILLSCSEDQTSRVYMNINNKYSEVNRPQIHGYDINSICILNNNTEFNLPKLVSASEEKILRIFDPPYVLAKYINSNTNNTNNNNTPIKYSKDSNKENDYFENSLKSGEKQALGLMTRQADIDNIYNNNNNTNKDLEQAFDIINFDPSSMLTHKSKFTDNISSDFYMKHPDEDFLTNNTLWGEANKLYGHAYEIYSTNTSYKGDLIVSAGKSQTEKHAKIFIWDPTKHELLDQLKGHNLTVTKLEFSKDDSLLLSVSRGKLYCIYLLVYKFSIIFLIRSQLVFILKKYRY